jgi:recombination protein RecT
MAQQQPIYNAEALVVKKDEFKNQLAQVQEDIKQALPALVDKERYIRVILTAVNTNPTLLTCTPASLFAGILDSAKLGLEFNTPLGLAYLIPYGGKAQFQIGYKGLLTLARRSGQIAKIDADVVYEKDHFKYVKGLHTIFEHEPYIPHDGEEGRGKIRLAYAFAILTSGEEVITILPVEEINKRKNANQAVKKGFKSAWDDWYDEMALKSALKKLSKLIPQSVELARAIELDNKAESGKVREVNFEAMLSPKKQEGPGIESLLDDSQIIETEDIADESEEVVKNKSDAAVNHVNELIDKQSYKDDSEEVDMFDKALGDTK